MNEDLGIMKHDGMFIANVYVDDKWRRKGIGNSLILCCVTEIMLLKKQVYLWTYEERLRNWYELIGFVVVDTMDNYLSVQ